MNNLDERDDDVNIINIKDRNETALFFFFFFISKEGFSDYSPGIRDWLGCGRCGAARWGKALLARAQEAKAVAGAQEVNTAELQQLMYVLLNAATVSLTSHLARL